jgi:hypothetical protein
MMGIVILTKAYLPLLRIIFCSYSELLANTAEQQAVALCIRIIYLTTLSVAQVTKRTAVAVTLLTRIREVRGSNLGRKICYPTEIFCGFLQLLHADAVIVP